MKAFRMLSLEYTSHIKLINFYSTNVGFHKKTSGHVSFSTFRIIFLIKRLKNCNF